MTPEWMRNGACLNKDPDTFFPENHGRAPVDAAKAVCNTQCPVVAQCLEYALKHQEIHGVWGGMSERERDKLRNPRIRTKASPHTGKIRKLAGLGWTDPEIARHIGLRPETVFRIRKAADPPIPAGKWALTRRSLGRTA